MPRSLTEIDDKMSIIQPNNGVFWFFDDLTCEIIAKSGIASDRYHLGKIIKYSLEKDPGFLHQVDGGTGGKETAGSMLNRSIKCAISLTKLGVKKGDVLVLMAPNHLDLAVPCYAGTYLGVIVSPVDRTLRQYELAQTFKINRPKIVFCQSEKVTEVETALKDSNLISIIVQFDKEATNNNVLHFSSLLEVKDELMNNFKCTEYDPKDTLGFLLPTSGTTGVPKLSAVTYKNLIKAKLSIFSRCTKFPQPFVCALFVAPLQWLSTFAHITLRVILRYTTIQTSKTITDEHLRYLIETYKPNFTVLSPTMLATLLKHQDKEPCDITCFEMLFIGGSAVLKELIEEINRASPKTVLIDAYGMTELAALVFQGPSPPGSCGRPIMIYQHRLVNIETLDDIDEPHVSGELWLKGPMFREYYNDPKTTKQSFVDGWFKTGDIFYRDEHWNFYFVERIKLLLKYKSYQISPVEIEKVIRQHSGVLDVAVTGILDKQSGDLPVACVVLRTGHNVTAQEIKDLVKETLSDAKQLRGGVVFMDELPLTPSTKINRKKLRDLVQNIDIQN